MRKKLEFLPTTFPVNLSGMALPIISKVDYNFEYCTLLFLFSKVQEPALICELYSKLTWKCTNNHVFTAAEGRQTFSPERFEGSVHLHLPF